MKQKCAQNNLWSLEILFLLLVLPNKQIAKLVWVCLRNNELLLVTIQHANLTLKKGCLSCLKV